MRILIVLSALLLAGCMTPAQRQAKAISASLKETFEDGKKCMEMVQNKLDYAPLFEKMPLDSSKASLEQLTDSSKIDGDNKRLLSLAHSETAQCRASLIAGVQRALPSGTPTLIEASQEDDAIIVALYGGAISYGEANTRRKAVAAKTISAFTDVLRRADAQLSAQSAQQAAERERSSAMWMQFLQNQQAINAMSNASNRPVMTNCNSWGNQTNCVSQ